MPASSFLSHWQRQHCLVDSCNIPSLQKQYLGNHWRFISHPLTTLKFTHLNFQCSYPKDPNTHGNRRVFNPDFERQLLTGGFLSGTFTSHLAPSTAHGGQEPAPLPSPGPSGGERRAAELGTAPYPHRAGHGPEPWPSWARALPRMEPAGAATPARTLCGDPDAYRFQRLLRQSYKDKAPVPLADFSVRTWSCCHLWVRTSTWIILYELQECHPKMVEYLLCSFTQSRK